MVFTLDTSGTVRLPDDVYNYAHRARFGSSLTWEWDDLDPFTQGFIEALFASLSVDLIGEWLDQVDPFRSPAFRDLASETVAAILKDCERFTTTPVGRDPFLRDAPRSDFPVADWLRQRGTEKQAGAALWAHRNGNRDAFFPSKVVGIDITPKLEALAKSFPPLTAYLGDDGKVYLREIS